MKSKPNNMEYKVKSLTRLGMLIPLIFLITSAISCKKFLDKKPDQSLAVPSSLGDLQAILDDQKGGDGPAYLELVADNYYVTSASWNAARQDDRLNYIWDKDAKIIDQNYIWSQPYTAIYEANFVLDLLPKILIDGSEQTLYNRIKGTALFYRAYSFYQLAQAFCRPYSSSAGSDLGIVLKLSSIVTETYSRSTVQQTYDRIIADLKEAAELLPVVSAFATRPNKAAAYGALARTFLSMRDYVNAATYANAALSINDTLLDYNSLAPANTLPVNYTSNQEVLFSFRAIPNLLQPSQPIIDSNLYQTYNNNDLRKAVFFANYPGGNNPYWKGSYYSTSLYYSVFTGIATDEIYLIRAECNARAGNKDDAMNDLNALLRKRWKTGLFTDLTASTANDALSQILIERRKELLFRGLRWTDLRRFNLENANITLTRIINGITYTLPPNDLRWVLLIPELEINRSGISQNPR